MCQHNGGNLFQLEPDLLIEQGKRQWVLDTKWKRLDETDRDKKYQLSQADFYQLFAYGQRYLGGEGDMALIYPAWRRFTGPLPVFEFDRQLRLHVLPFDLDNDILLHPDGPYLPIHFDAQGI